VLTGVDAATGSPRWTSSTWAAGAVGSRSAALVATGGHLLVAVTTTRLDGDTTVLQVRDLTTGEPVGPELAAPAIPAALLDTGDGTAHVHEQEEQSATSGVYGVDMASGTTLWTLDAADAATAAVAGGGLVWVQNPDGGYTAVDDRTGTVRAKGLDLAPVVDDGDSLTATALP